MENIPEYKEDAYVKIVGVFNGNLILIVMLYFVSKQLGSKHITQHISLKHCLIRIKIKQVPLTNIS